MADVPDEQKSVRRKIVEALMAALELSDVTYPTDDPFGIKWSLVADSPITEQQMKPINSAICLTDGDQADSEKNYPFVTAAFQLMVDVHVKVDSGSRAAQLDLAMTAAYRCIKAQRDVLSGTGLLIDIASQGQTRNLDGLWASVVDGMLQFLVTYRHSTNDPRG